MVFSFSKTFRSLAAAFMIPAVFVSADENLGAADGAHIELWDVATQGDCDFCSGGTFNADAVAEDAAGMKCGMAGGLALSSPGTVLLMFPEDGKVIFPYLKDACQLAQYSSAGLPECCVGAPTVEQLTIKFMGGEELAACDNCAAGQIFSGSAVPDLFNATIGFDCNTIAFGVKIPTTFAEYVADMKMLTMTDDKCPNIQAMNIQNGCCTASSTFETSVCPSGVNADAMIVDPTTEVKLSDMVASKKCGHLAATCELTPAVCGGTTAVIAALMESAGCCNPEQTAPVVPTGGDSSDNAALAAVSTGVLATAAVIALML